MSGPPGDLDALVATSLPTPIPPMGGTYVAYSDMLGTPREKACFDDAWDGGRSPSTSAQLRRRLVAADSDGCARGGGLPTARVRTNRR